MNYMGGKIRLAKHLVPIIQGHIDLIGADTYVEPFCGGCNIIDNIKCKTRIAGDINKYLIALLKNAHKLRSFTREFTKSEYDYINRHRDEYADWIVGAVGFLCSFGGKFFGGFVQPHMNRGKSRQREATRGLLKQLPDLDGVQYRCCDYTEHKHTGAVIYCDPPYIGKAKYSVDFDHDMFWEWVRQQSKDNVVLVSESSAPSDMEIVWQGETKFFISKSSNNHISIEKLYRAVYNKNPLLHHEYLRKK